jgi:hypothetical protein
MRSSHRSDISHGDVHRAPHYTHVSPVLPASERRAKAESDREAVAVYLRQPIVRQLLFAPGVLSEDAEVSDDNVETLFAKGGAGLHTLAVLKTIVREKARCASFDAVGEAIRARTDASLEALDEAMSYLNLRAPVRCPLWTRPEPEPVDTRHLAPWWRSFTTMEDLDALQRAERTFPSLDSLGQALQAVHRTNTKPHDPDHDADFEHHRICGACGNDHMSTDFQLCAQCKALLSTFSSLHTRPLTASNICRHSSRLLQSRLPEAPLDQRPQREMRSCADSSRVVNCEIYYHSLRLNQAPCVVADQKLAFGLPSPPALSLFSHCSLQCSSEKLCLK